MDEEYKFTIIRKEGYDYVALVEGQEEFKFKTNFKLKDKLTTQPITVSGTYKGKFKKDDNGTIWLNHYVTILDEPKNELNDEVKTVDVETKKEEVKQVLSPYDHKQQLIIAQAMQHDATDIICAQIRNKEISSDDIITNISSLRDQLYENFMKKYYK